MRVGCLRFFEGTFSRVGPLRSLADGRLVREGSLFQLGARNRFKESRFEKSQKRGTVQQLIRHLSDQYFVDVFKVKGLLLITDFIVNAGPGTSWLFKISYWGVRF
jgi:hypothetical protein